MALALACCAQAHTRDDNALTIAAKIPSELEDKLTAGEAQDVLVELAPETDAPAADGGEVGARRQALVRDTSGLPPSEAEPIIDEDVATRADYYEAAQEAVLEAVEPNDVALLTRYEHVPFLFVRVNNLNGLHSLAERSEVLQLHEERQLEHQLAESLPLIHQPELLRMGKTGAGASVAVLDTGCNYRRSEFGSCSAPGSEGCRVAYAADLASDDKVLDDNGHGTNVSAIVLGVAPDAKVLALDVFSGSTAPSSAILAAIDWSIKNRSQYNIVALNMSLGSGMYNAQCTRDLFASALANARAAGIVPVVAAGNSGYSSALASPACTPAAISVGAVYDASLGNVRYGACSDTSAAADKVTCFSNSASFLTMLAPGAAIMAGGYRMSGTSQASPHVAGALALLRAAFPSEPLSQTLARLTDTGPNVTDSRNNLTKHRLDLQAAWNGAASSDTTAPTGSVNINAGASATNQTAVTLSIVGMDNSAVTSMCVSNAATSCTTFEAFAATKTWSVPAGDGDKTVRVTLRDATGNQTVVSDAIRLDTAAPSGGTLRAAPGDRQVALSWTAATDAGSGIASYRVVFTPSSSPACTAGTEIYRGSNLSYTHANLQNGSIYGYRVCPLDNAGNSGSGATAAARPAPELTAPVGTVQVNNGAAFVNNSAVTLALNATDPSGVTSMCLSNSATCTAWEPYKSSRAWTLSTRSGATSVYAWFRDRFDNASSSPVRANVTVDTVAPSGGVLNAAAGTQQIVLTWTPASDTSGIRAYRLVFAQSTAAPASCSGSPVYEGSALGYTHRGLRSGASYSYRLCAIDQAGNMSGSTRTLTAR